MVSKQGTNTSAVKATATRRLRGPVRRAQLVLTARRIILEQGIAALTMEPLAEAAGVTKPVVYKHFGNSEDVTVAVLREYAHCSVLFTTPRLEEA